MVTVCGMTFVDNINVLDSIDLALFMGRENPQTKRFLFNFKKCIHCGQLILRTIIKLVPPDVRF